MAKVIIKNLTFVIFLTFLGCSSWASSISPSGHLVRTAASIIVKERPVYLFGAHNPASGKYDCSSFVKETAQRANLGPLPRDSRSQFELLKQTGKVWLKGDPGWQDLRPGDLIFFSGTYRHSHPSPISHVMIYAGENQMIGAQSSGVGLFDFVPVPPKGSLGQNCKSLYRKSTVYAYARPDWRKVQYVASLKKSSPSTNSRPSAYQTASSSMEYRMYGSGNTSPGIPSHTIPSHTIPRPAPRVSVSSTGLWLPSR